MTAAVRAGLEVCEGTSAGQLGHRGGKRNWRKFFPSSGKYRVPVVGISNDESGISMNPEVRFAVARKIVERAADHGIPSCDVVIDPLVMPIGALGDAGRQVFALCRKLREELKVNTTCGASNISFGLPNRHGINASFLPMAIASGMTSAIMNPCRPQEMGAVRAADVLMGTDHDCAAWIRSNREQVLDATAGAGRRPRRRRARTA